MTTVLESAKWNPQAAPECFFGAPYTIMTAAITGNVFLPVFEDSERFRSDKRELKKKIVIIHDSSISQFEGFLVFKM